MGRVVVICCWIAVFALGAVLRFDDLAARPFHCDEATGARITAKRMEPGGYRFDPSHFHGPVLGSAAIPLCRLRGETGWRQMSKGTLRLVPAIAGSLAVLVPLLGRRRWGDAPMLLAAALLASSPLLVYYGRMYIHEPLLVLFGLLALFTLLVCPRWGIPGVFVGLMFAAKESFAISIVAWAGAGLLVMVENRKRIDRGSLRAAVRRHLPSVALSLVTAAATAGFFYSDGFRHPQGVADGLRTFFVYQVTEGHEKPFGYYLGLLLVPERSAGVWWFETPVLVLGLLAFLSTFRPGADGGAEGVRTAAHRPTIRFLAYAAAGHFLVYGLIRYKTPWLACLPWAHVCVLAGFGLAGWPRWRRPLRVAFSLAAALCLVSQAVQSRLATGRLASDDRNPYAYVPTSQDIETLVPWLGQLGAASPETPLQPIGVIGAGYWPLPWYLRPFELTGYWAEPPDNLDRLPLVFAVPDSLDAVLGVLAASHVPVPRGLRSEVPVTVFVRRDIWDNWMAR